MLNSEVENIRTGLTFDDVLLVPQRSPVRSRRDVDVSTKLSRHISLAVPLISANMDTVTEAPMAVAIAKLGGLGIIHRFLSIADQVAEVKKVKQEPSATGLLQVGAAIGVKDDYLERAQALAAVGVDVLVIDIAHGHSDIAIDATKKIKGLLPKIDLIVGNVATSIGTQELIAAGADAIKVGVGPGSMCTTRIVTGSGVPQLTAIMDAAVVAKKNNIPVIADGGLRTSGDVVKALAAGASSVMCGWFFAGTDESPGEVLLRDGHKMKVYQGSASRGSAEMRHQRMASEEDAGWRETVPEGIETTVTYKGSVERVVHQLLGGLRSGLSYSGATSIVELQKKAEFIRVTSAGLGENIAHGINR